MDKNKLVAFIESRGYKINADVRDLLYDKLVGRNGIIVKALKRKGNSQHGGISNAPLDWNNEANRGASQYSPGNEAGTNTDQTDMTRQAINSTFESTQSGGGSCNMCQSGGARKPVKFITIMDTKRICNIYGIELKKGEVKGIAEKSSAEIGRLMHTLLHNATKTGIIDKKRSIRLSAQLICKKIECDLLYNYITTYIYV
jgi:hypothetical protein